MPNEPPQLIKLGRIRTFVIDALGWTLGIANLDSEIEDGDVIPIVQKLSGQIERDIRLNGLRAKHPQKLTVGSLAQYVFENQAQFEPLPPKTETKKT